MLIYLFRHGETEWNIQKRYTGTADVPLSKEGRRKLRALDCSVSVVYTSDLSRAQETARILFPDARIIPIHGLREMSFGDFTGHNFDELQHDPAYRTWVEGGCVHCCPNGEEDRDGFTARVCRTFSRLVDDALREDARYLMIVAHGGTQMAVMSRFVQSTCDYFDWQTGNGGAFVLDSARWEEDRMLQLVGTLNRN